MHFNFKQSLEYSRTPEGKAEDFLKGILDVIKHMQPFDKLSFHLASALTSKHSPPYSIYAVAKNGNIIYTFDPIYDYNEAILIFNAVESKLQSDGFDIHSENAILNKIKSTANSFGGYRASNLDRSGCSTCELCTSILCADFCCDCFGGDLIRCC